jgi:ribonuclease P protein component
VGIIVPRHGHTAVERNRLKRRLREIVRQDLLPAEQGVDLIVRTAPAAYSLPFADLRTEIGGALRRVVS